MTERIALKFLSENNGTGGKHKRDTQRDRNDMGYLGALLRQEGQRPDGQNGSWYAAAGQQAGNAPVDMAFPGMDGGAAGLGDGGVEQVGTDCCRWVDTEKQYQQRGHERAAANAGQSDNRANCKA